MSALSGPAKSLRSSRAVAAVERARLSLVQPRRTPAPRAPFVVLVLAILGAGVVGLLMFNTHMQQTSFYATRLQQRADALVARQQKLDLELEGLRDPQRLALAARDLGMVAPGVPAFIELGAGRIVGTPTVASPEDTVTIKPKPPALPAPLKPAPLVITVRQPATTPTTPTTPTTATTPAQGAAR
jgi:cell division protein FtsB